MTSKGWTPTPEAFEKLLALLGPDREAAGAAYENIRQKLVKFFQWRGCPLPEESADRVIDRVTRRLEEGKTIDVDKPYLYFHGVQSMSCGSAAAKLEVSLSLATLPRRR